MDLTFFGRCAALTIPAVILGCVIQTWPAASLLLSRLLVTGLFHTLVATVVMEAEVAAFVVAKTHLKLVPLFPLSPPASFLH